MSSEIDDNLLVDIEPLWMVVLALSNKCGLGHESESFNEVSERVLPVQFAF